MSICRDRGEDTLQVGMEVALINVSGVTTTSLAMRPVSRATEDCQLPNPRGHYRCVVPIPRDAFADFRSLPPRLKLDKNQTRTDRKR